MTTSWFSVVQLCTFLSQTKQTCWLVHRLNSCFLARQWQNPWHLQKHGYDTKTLNLTNKLVFLSLHWSLVRSNLVKSYTGMLPYQSTKLFALSHVVTSEPVYLNSSGKQSQTTNMLHNSTKKQLYRPGLRFLSCVVCVCVTFCQVWFTCCNCCFNVFTLLLVLVSIVLKIVFTITQVYQLFLKENKEVVMW